jgi:hypothetical protein
MKNIFRFYGFLFCISIAFIMEGLGIALYVNYWSSLFWGLHWLIWIILGSELYHQWRVGNTNNGKGEREDAETGRNV